MLSVMKFNVIIPSVNKLNIVMQSVFYAQFHYAECHYAACYNADVITLIVIIMIAFLFIGIMLKVIALIVQC
jgi:hypothetical protein